MHSNHLTEGAPTASAAMQADPVTEARRVLADDERARTEACAQEIADVLAKHGMRLETTVARVVLVPGPMPEVDA